MSGGVRGDEIELYRRSGKFRVKSWETEDMEVLGTYSAYYALVTCEVCFTVLAAEYSIGV